MKNIYDMTIREIQDQGLTVTVTIYSTSRPVTPLPANPDAPTPLLPAEDTPATQPAPTQKLGEKNPANPLTTPSADDLATILNKVASQVSPEKARELLGEGKTLADVTDPAKMFAQCQQVLEAADVPF